jgi:hypothetical protein
MGDAGDGKALFAVPAHDASKQPANSELMSRIE